MDATELRPGLWRWTAPHPDWTPGEGGSAGWERDVGCLLLETDEGIVLVDPLAPPDGSEAAGRFWEELDRDVERSGGPPNVLLTVFWHERSAAELAARYGASVWADPRRLDRLSFAPHRHIRPGDELPGGVRALDAGARNEVLLWVERHRALVAGDVLLGDPERGVRLCPESWLHEGLGHADLRKALAPLLELPVELLLVSHGEPVLAGAHEALARALEN